MGLMGLAHLKGLAPDPRKKILLDLVNMYQSFSKHGVYRFTYQNFQARIWVDDIAILKIVVEWELNTFQDMVSHHFYNIRSVSAKITLKWI